MLQIVNGPPVATQDYAIIFKENGLDELDFEISRSDPAYRYLREEALLLETTEDQLFQVKKLSGQRETVRCACQLYLDDWRRDIFLNYSDLAMDGFSHTRSETAMLEQELMGSGSSLALAGWIASVTVTTSKTREISMQGPTPLDVALQMAKTFGCAFHFDTRHKTVSMFYPEERPMGNAYAIETVNLLEAPVFKGDSSELATRLFPVGKDGLGISGVEPHGRAYVEDTTYTGGTVISRIWRDERYTDAASLYADALAKLDGLCRPRRSWQLKLVDLNAIDPLAWPGLQLGMFDRIRLVDVIKGEQWDVQIRELKKYPYHPEKTLATVATATLTVQGTVKNLYEAINNPNSEFYQKLNA